MEEAEARKLAQAIANVAQHYDAIPGMSEKSAAWAGLGMVMAGAYGPRIMAYRLRMMNEAREAGGQTSVALL